MTYAAVPYGGAPYGAGEAVVQVHTAPITTIEVAFGSDALSEDPQWTSVAHDMRDWSVTRGRRRELERFQPGMAFVTLANRARQYDSQNAAGPYVGNLRPMRRLRIRQTFGEATHPVFDGFVDSWFLDYPNKNDATAIPSATDGMKVLARTDLARSVYTQVVEDDAPAIWWRLDEAQTVADETLTALNSGTLGAAADGTYVGPPTLGAEGLIVHDPGTSMGVTDLTLSPGTADMGVFLDDADFDLAASDSWAVEMWVRPGNSGPSPNYAFIQANGGDLSGSGVTIQWVIADFSATYENSVGTQFITTVAGVKVAHERYHVVAKHGPNRLFTLYVNGVADVTPATTTGTLTAGDIRIGYEVGNPLDNWVGEISDVAIYTSALAVDPLTDAQVAAHYAAGTAPWQGDDGDNRAVRILDLADYPSNLRFLDDLATTLQSATTDGQTTQEHLEKIAETEYGKLFFTRDGLVRLISRTNVFGAVSADTFDGDDYRSLRFDEGDSVIRNSATISRLNGVAKSAVDAASVTEFGRFQYTLDGLLHDTDAHSLAYAGFIRDEFADMRRRVTDITFGPFDATEGATMWPRLLAREIGDVITVNHVPPGGGAAFQQACVIEGITWSGRADKTATTVSWALSPAPAGSF